MDNYSSEIEIAMKIGQLKLTGNYIGSWGTENGSTLIDVLKSLNVNLDKDPLTEDDLSIGLRKLTMHRGDVSYERFIKSINWNHAHDIEALASFILGIGYIYPPTSLSYNIEYMFNKRLPIPFNNNKNITDLYNTARKMYEHAKNLRHSKKK